MSSVDSQDQSPVHSVSRRASADHGLMFALDGSPIKSPLSPYKHHHQLPVVHESHKHLKPRRIDLANIANPVASVAAHSPIVPSLAPPTQPAIPPPIEIDHLHASVAAAASAIAALPVTRPASTSISSPIATAPEPSTGPRTPVRQRGFEMSRNSPVAANSYAAALRSAPAVTSPTAGRTALSLLASTPKSAARKAEAVVPDPVVVCPAPPVPAGIALDVIKPSLGKPPVFHMPAGTSDRRRSTAHSHLDAPSPAILPQRSPHVFAASPYSPLLHARMSPFSSPHLHSIRGVGLGAFTLGTAAHPPHPPVAHAVALPVPHVGELEFDWAVGGKSPAHTATSPRFESPCPMSFSESATMSSSPTLPSVATLSVEVIQSSSPPRPIKRSSTHSKPFIAATPTTTTAVSPIPARPHVEQSDQVVQPAPDMAVDESADIDDESDDETSDVNVPVDSTAASSSNQTGPRLADFELLRVLGKGSYGKVMLAKHVLTSQLYAIKILRKDVVLERQQVANTRSERDVLISIRHPFIVHMHCAFQTHSKLYLVLDFIPGGELFTRLNVIRRLPEDIARFYAAEIVLVFEHLHASDILYRDLKPENILLNHDGHLCLTDFGMAKQLDNENASSNTFCGTVEYMSPEVVNGTQYGKEADWWALGVLIFEMLTGTTPFKGQNRKKVQQNILNAALKIPGNLSFDSQQIIKKLLQRPVHKRLGHNGAREVMKADFFAAIDWNKLARKEVDAPYVPERSNPMDTSHFEATFTNQRAFDSPAELQLSPHTQAKFAGFSFTRSPVIAAMAGGADGVAAGPEASASRPPGF